MLERISEDFSKIPLTVFQAYLIHTSYLYSCYRFDLGQNERWNWHYAQHSSFIPFHTSTLLNVDSIKHASLSRCNYTPQIIAVDLTFLVCKAIHRFYILSKI